MSKRRISRGVALAELIGILLILFPLILAAIDLTAVMLAKNVNESICKDVARSLSLYNFEPEELIRAGPCNKNSAVFAYADKILSAHNSAQNKMLAKVKIENITLDDIGQDKMPSANPDHKRVTVEVAMDLALPFAVPPVTPVQTRLLSKYSYPLCTLEQKDNYSGDK